MEASRAVSAKPPTATPATSSSTFRSTTSKRRWRRSRVLGGKAEMGPMEIPAGKIAHFSDPEGHTLGLWQNA